MHRLNQNRLILVFIMFAFVACNWQQRQNTIHSLPQPFDTLEVLSKLHLTDSLSLFNQLVPVETKAMYAPDTFVMRYSFCACGTYPMWLNHLYSTDSSYKFAFIKRYYDLLEPMGLVAPEDSNRAEFSARYYLEPASKELSLPWRQVKDGNRVKVIGQLYKTPQMPDPTEGYMGNPPVAIKLVYYSYEMLRPYEVWGPDRYVEFDSLEMDSIFSSTHLIIH